MTVTTQEALAACDRLGVPLEVSLLQLRRAFFNYVCNDRTHGHEDAACYRGAIDLGLILTYNGYDAVTVRYHQQDFVRQVNDLTLLIDPSDKLSYQPTILTFLEEARDGSQTAVGDNDRGFVPPNRYRFWGWLRGAFGR